MSRQYSPPRLEQTINPSLTRRRRPGLAAAHSGTVRKSQSSFVFLFPLLSPLSPSFSSAFTHSPSGESNPALRLDYVLTFDCLPVLSRNFDLSVTIPTIDWLLSGHIVSTMIPYIPEDVLKIIVDHVTERIDLARCCSTSRMLLSLARLPLYTQIRMCVQESVEYSSVGSYNVVLSLLTGSARLLTTLRNFVHLRPLVLEVCVEGVPPSEDSHGPVRKIQMNVILAELFRLLPSVRMFELDNVLFHTRVDETVTYHQARLEAAGGAGRSQAFRLVVRGDQAQVADRLTGRYEGFQLVPFTTTGPAFQANRRLAASRDTLRYLSIPLDDETDLSQFQRIERLSLRLCPRVPSRVLPNLRRVISSLRTLQQLVLTGTAPMSDIAGLVLAGDLARSLPPQLTRLSFAFKLDSADLRELSQALIKVTSVRMLDLPDQDEEPFAVGVMESAKVPLSEKSECVRGFVENGGVLTFGEEWSLW